MKIYSADNNLNHYKIFTLCINYSFFLIDYKYSTRTINSSKRKKKSIFFLYIFINFIRMPLAYINHSFCLVYHELATYPNPKGQISYVNFFLIEKSKICQHVALLIQI